MRAIAEAIDAIEYVAQRGSRLAVSDAGAAAVLASAAVQAAAFNVYINASSMDDRDRADAYRSEADGIVAASEARCAAVRDAVLDEVR